MPPAHRPMTRVSSAIRGLKRVDEVEPEVEQPRNHAPNRQPSKVLGQQQVGEGQVGTQCPSSAAETKQQQQQQDEQGSAGTRPGVPAGRPIKSKVQGLWSRALQKLSPN
mmetsp:Transcript_26577/g.57989  ORF Transcript_26577/g.57989 Transcript_26577/m.57989 type:complete len:109 (+) Transcript_26577:541-867(+)